MCRLPSASSAATTWSSSPRLAPPVVTITSKRARRLRQLLLHRLQVVGEHAEVGGGRARAGNERRQHRRVGVVHLTRAAARRRRAPPRRRSRRWRPSGAGSRSTSPKPSEASAERSCGRSTAPVPSTVSPSFTSSPALRTLAPRFRPGRDGHDLSAVDRAGAHVLLHDDGVVPLGHDGAGEDARRRPRRGLARQRMPGRRPALDGQLARRPPRRSRWRQRRSRRRRHWCAPAPAAARPPPPPGCAPPPRPAARAPRRPPAAPAPSGSPGPRRGAGASCRARSSRRAACSAWGSSNHSPAAADTCSAPLSTRLCVVLGRVVQGGYP